MAVEPLSDLACADSAHLSLSPMATPGFSPGSGGHTCPVVVGTRGRLWPQVWTTYLPQVSEVHFSKVNRIRV